VLASQRMELKCAPVFFQASLREENKRREKGKGEQPPDNRTTMRGIRIFNIRQTPEEKESKVGGAHIIFSFTRKRVGKGVGAREGEKGEK